MRTKRQLIEIASSARPQLRESLAELALLESIRGSEINCIELLRAAALATAMNPRTPEERRSAMEVLDEIGLRGSRRIYEASLMLTPSIRDSLAELATVGHVVVGGGERLLEAAAMLSSLRDADASEREAAKGMLRRLGNSHSCATFSTLVKIGMLSVSDLAKFIELQLELYDSKGR